MRGPNKPACLTVRKNLLTLKSLIAVPASGAVAKSRFATPTAATRAAATLTSAGTTVGYSTTC